MKQQLFGSEWKSSRNNGCFCVASMGLHMDDGAEAHAAIRYMAAKRRSQSV